MKKKTLALIAAAVLTATMSFALPRKAAEITMSGYEGSSTLENFPVLVRISPERIDGFSYADCAEGGADISFQDAAGNALDFEIDTWDASGESLVWVKVPSLSGNATKISFRWNDPAPAAHTPSSTWSGYAGVWHLNETADGAVAISDSTANGVNGTAHSTSTSKTGGKVGRARNITTHTGHTPASDAGGITIDSANMAAIDAVTPEFTVSMWARTLNAKNNYEYFISRKLADADQAWAVQLMNSCNPASLRYYSAGTADNQVANPNPQIKGAMGGVWHKYDFIWKSEGSYAIYIDGSQNSSVGNNLTGNLYNKAVAVNGTYPLCIGGTYPEGTGKGGRGFYGDMDEVRICAGVLSADWVAADYAQVNDASFLTYGAAETLASDNRLMILGAPAELSSPTPAYGPVDNLLPNASVSLSMASTAVPGEGTVTNYLRGWKLEAVDVETGARTLLRSSSDAGEVIDRCAYVHASYAAFTWLWDVRDALGVGAPALVANGGNSLTLSTDVAGIGFTAPSATLRLVYGASPDALTSALVVSNAVTAVGTYTATLPRLTPGAVYYVKAVLETNEETPAVAESETVCVQTSAAEESEPGLWQTYFTNANPDWTKDVWAVPVGTNWLNYTDVSRIRRRELGPIAAYACTKTTTLTAQYTSEIWGDNVYWPGVNNGQFAYAGHIYLEDGKSYKFRTTIDDNELVKITDAGTGEATLLINQTGNGNGTLTSDAFTPTVSGWHAIEVRFSDGSGDRGGCNNGNGYKNTTNLGFSQDGGATWALLLDPGDGSLLRAPDAKAITATENVADGALASVSLAFDAADAARTLFAAWGPAHGGGDPADWLATNAVATVAAGATSATWTPPADWGSDTNLVVRFYFDGNPFQWSNAIFWHDYSAPSMADVALDGAGGDTLVVSGTLESFPGGSCTLSIFTGDSPTTLTTAWTGLAGAVRDTTGAFSLTLFEGDTASPRYLAPGSSLYATVEAVADGKVTRTAPVAVTMKAAPAFASVSASVSRRTVTFTGNLSDLGQNNAATVTLYVGAEADAEADLAAVEAPVVRTATGAFTIAHTFDAFETTHTWQLRAVSTAAGGTSTLETRTAVGTCATVDTTTYTWTGAGADSKWSNPDNWTDNQGGDCLGYPRTAAASAIFPAGTVAEVVFTEALTVGTVTLTAANLELTFAQGGASTNATKLTSANFNINGAGGCITFDGVAVRSNGNLDMGAGRALRIVNGANVSANIFYQDEGQDVLLSGGSYLACTENHFGGGTFVIDDSTFWTTSHDYVGKARQGGRIVIKGAHPLWYHAGTGGHFRSDLADANVQIDFLVPAGGFPFAPIQGKATPVCRLGDNGNAAGKSTFTVNVLDESPANFADETVTSPLILWPAKGVNKDMVLEGHLPVWGAGTATDDAFAWNDPEAANPTNLSVRIVGSSHAAQLQVSGYPEAVASAALSPAYGYTALAADASRTCAAPSDYVYLSETKRALCTGWKLYDVDAATLARTLADSGDTASAPVTGTGLWQELEWQWRIEYKVAVTAGAGGTAAASETWVADGATVTVSATPDADYGFAGWSGDVADEDRMKSSFSFTVDGRAYALAASFNAAYYVATGGSDENDGLSAATPLATIGEALARGALHIYVAEGVYDITNTLTVSNATTIEGTGANRGAVIRYTKNFNGYSRDFAVQLLHADAALRNLAVTTSANDSKYAYVRGVRMTGGLIDDCAITNCIASNGSYDSGGGVNMSGGILRNSLLDGNSIYGAGGLKTYGGNINASGGLIENCVIRRGGARNRTNLYYAGLQATGGTIVRNCLIEGNKAADGGGFAVYLKNATMENCTIVGNEAPNSTSGSALYVDHDNNNPVVVRNTIVWGNTTAGGLSNWAVKNPSNPNFTAERVITVPAMAGTGNTDADPLFRDFENGDYHPTLGSARNAGVALDWMADATDVDGNPRIAEGAPDIGCHEYVPAALDCSFDVSAGGALDSDTVTFAATVVGADLTGLVYSWTITDQAGNETARSGADLATLTLTLGPGVYSVALDVENGAHDTASYARNNVVTVFPSHIYVDVNGANVMPFASYANGATNILDAVAFATSGTTIHVADGFYRYNSEIVLNDAIRIVSENGPTNAFFFCSQAPHGLRSVNLANAGAVVSGIAITGIDTDNPASVTHDVYRYDLRKNQGKAPGAQPYIGGVRITSAGGTVTNCFIVNHRAGTGAGATIAGGTVVDCLFTNNWDYCTGGSGGAGGGIHVDGANALVERCAFLSNCVYYGSTSYGGGANVANGTLRNCLFVGNQCTTGYGGNLAVRGAGARVYHCTAVKGFGSLGNGGLYQSAGTVADCIFYDNVGNTTAEDTDDPGFANYPEDLHLSAASPAVDAATSGQGGDLDLDHMPRVSGPAADKGCFEYDKSQFDIGVAYAAASPFSDEPVVLSAIVTPEGTLLDEAQTWWTFDGTEPSASNHDAVGSTVTHLFGLGTWTVRFKTVHDGQTYTADKPNWFTRYGRTVYVVQENPGSAFPYGTPETAATNLSDAVACAMDGATILIGDGTFPLADGVKYVGRNLVIRSENGPGRTTIDANGKNAMFYIRSGEWKVVIDGIRFVNGSGYVDGGAIRISDADSVVTNCVFDSCHASHYGGGAISADAGMIVDCLFTNCWCGGGNEAAGAVIRAIGASCLIDRCILLDSHYVHDAAIVSRAALYVSNGTVRNTVVARSRLTGEGGILATGSAKVQNCTVVDNVSELAGYVAGIKVEGSATVKNTILWNNVNVADNARAEMGGDASRFDHCFTDDPGLVGKRGREFQIRSNSPCRDAGVVESWMTGALDVYRQPRIDNPKHSVDIGAAECQKTEGTMLIMR